MSEETPRSLSLICSRCGLETDSGEDSRRFPSSLQMIRAPDEGRVDFTAEGAAKGAEIGSMTIVARFNYRSMSRVRARKVHFNPNRLGQCCLEPEA